MVLSIMAYSLSASVKCTVPFSAGLAPQSRGNDRILAHTLPGMDHAGICVIALVGDKLRGLERGEQDVGTIEIAGLPATEVKAQRIPQGIHGCMNLGAQSAFAAADGLGAVFLRAPALC